MQIIGTQVQMYLPVTFSHVLHILYHARGKLLGVSLPQACHSS